MGFGLFNARYQVWRAVGPWNEWGRGLAAQRPRLPCRPGLHRPQHSPSDRTEAPARGHGATSAQPRPPIRPCLAIGHVEGRVRQTKDPSCTATAGRLPRPAGPALRATRAPHPTRLSCRIHRAECRDAPVDALRSLLLPEAGVPPPKLVLQKAGLSALVLRSVEPCPGELPGSVGLAQAALAAVRTLDLSRNALRWVPPELFTDLPSLVALNLSHNKLQSLPPEFWLCTSLRRLELQCDSARREAFAAECSAPAGGQVPHRVSAPGADDGEDPAPGSPATVAVAGGACSTSLRFFPPPFPPGLADADDDNGDDDDDDDCGAAAPVAVLTGAQAPHRAPPAQGRAAARAFGLSPTASLAADPVTAAAAPPFHGSSGTPPRRGVLADPPSTPRLEPSSSPALPADAASVRSAVTAQPAPRRQRAASPSSHAAGLSGAVRPGRFRTNSGFGINSGFGTAAAAGASHTPPPMRSAARAASSASLLLLASARDGADDGEVVRSLSDARALQRPSALDSGDDARDGAAGARQRSSPSAPPAAPRAASSSSAPSDRRRGRPRLLPRLAHVDLSCCGVEVILPAVGELSGLTKLRLNGNELRSLPLELASLPALTIVDVEDNPLMDVPPALKARRGVHLVTGVPDEILPGLFLGDARAARNVEALRARHVHRVVMVSSELRPQLGAGLDTVVIPVKDVPSETLAFSRCPDPYFYRFAMLPARAQPTVQSLRLHDHVPDSDAAADARPVELPPAPPLVDGAGDNPGPAADGPGIHTTRLRLRFVIDRSIHRFRAFAHRVIVGASDRSEAGSEGSVFSTPEMGRRGAGRRDPDDHALPLSAAMITAPIPDVGGEGRGGLDVTDGGGMALVVEEEDEDDDAGSRGSAGRPSGGSGVEARGRGSGGTSDTASSAPADEAPGAGAGHEKAADEAEEAEAEEEDEDGGGALPDPRVSSAAYDAVPLSAACVPGAAAASPPASPGGRTLPRSHTAAVLRTGAGLRAPGGAPSAGPVLPQPGAAGLSVADSRESLDGSRAETEGAPHARRGSPSRPADTPPSSSASPFAVPVFVHCQAGASRSATIVIALVMRIKGWSLRRAFAHVKARRSVVAPNLGFFAQLQRFERTLFDAGLIRLDEDDVGAGAAAGHDALPTLSVQRFDEATRGSMDASVWAARYGHRAADSSSARLAGKGGIAAGSGRGLRARVLRPHAAAIPRGAAPPVSTASAASGASSPPSSSRAQPFFARRHTSAPSTKPAEAEASAAKPAASGAGAAARDRPMPFFSRRRHAPAPAPGPSEPAPSPVPESDDAASVAGTEEQSPRLGGAFWYEGGGASRTLGAAARARRNSVTQF